MNYAKKNIYIFKQAVKKDEVSNTYTLEISLKTSVRYKEVTVSFNDYEAIEVNKTHKLKYYKLLQLINYNNNDIIFDIKIKKIYFIWLIGIYK